MKKGKLFTILSASLIAAIGLTACQSGLSEVSREDGVKILAAIEAKQGTNFTAPRVLTAKMNKVTTEITSNGEDEDTVSDSLEMTSSYDFDKRVSYLNIAAQKHVGEDNTANKMQAWAWYADGKFYEAAISEEGKPGTYQFSAVSEEQADQLLQSSFPVMNALSMVLDQTMGLITDSVSQHKDIPTTEQIKIAYGEKAEFSVTETFKTGGKDSLQYFVEENLTGVVEPEIGSEISTYAKFDSSIENYIVTKIDMQTKITATLGDDSVVTKMDMNQNATFTSDITLPDLSKFVLKN